MIETENNDDVQLTLDNGNPLTDEEFLLHDVAVPENFKFQVNFIYGCAPEVLKVWMARKCGTLFINYSV